MDIIKGIIFSSVVATVVMAILVFVSLDIDSLLLIASMVLSINLLNSILTFIPTYLIFKWFELTIYTMLIISYV